MALVVFVGCFFHLVSPLAHRRRQRSTRVSGLTEDIATAQLLSADLLSTSENLALQKIIPWRHFRLKQFTIDLEVAKATKATLIDWMDLWTSRTSWRRRRCTLQSRCAIALSYTLPDIINQSINRPSEWTNSKPMNHTEATNFYCKLSA